MAGLAKPSGLASNVSLNKAGSSTSDGPSRARKGLSGGASFRRTLVREKANHQVCDTESGMFEMPRGVRPLPIWDNYRSPISAC